MKFGKVFKVFKKGAKAAAKHKGKKGAEPVRWPGGTRIGIFGHANAGKTVYMTVLNEECKISKNLQISVTDNATAGEFLSNYRSIWGLGTADSAGTVVDFQGEKKFPDATDKDKLFQFNAIIDRGKKLSVVAYDYNGKAVSISTRDEAADKVIDFMSGCDGILFFYDPKMLGAELESQAHVASFVNMLEYLAPLGSRLPIPLAIVVTKADVSGDDQVTLVNPGDEYIVAEDFELFLERILSSPKIAGNPAWSGSVRNVLVKMKDFLRVVLGRTLDFQLFFISATGQTPEKIGTEVGRSIYTPPAKMQPIGVKEPFYWLLNSIIRNKRISRFRTIAKYVTVLSLIWVILFSIPPLIHFKYLYPKPARVESSVIESSGGSIYSLSDKGQRTITSAYRKYEQSVIVKWFFEDFIPPSLQIREGYEKDMLSRAKKDLNMRIADMAAIVIDTTKWPGVNPSDTTLILDSTHEKIISGIDRYHTGDDEASILFIRSGRALVLWDLFTKGVLHPNDTAVWRTIQDQVESDRKRYKDLSSDEKDLMNTLTDRKIKKEKVKVAKEAAVQLDDLIATINENSSPSYRLKKAVDTLKKIKGLVDKGSLKKINKYISEANKFRNPQTFEYTIENIPGDWHLHIDVTGKGEDPSWSDEEQKLGNIKLKYTLQWKVGDIIHIALDSLHTAGTEAWGKNSKDKKSLKGKYSIFDMEKGITFDNTGVKVNFSFTENLTEKLPELK
jgi:hypothetical protein